MCLSWRETTLAIEFTLHIIQSARANADNYSSHLQLFAIIFAGSCSVHVSAKNGNVL